MLNCLHRFIVVALVLFVGSMCHAATWVVHEGAHLAQNSALLSEVLPAEDMDPTHTITWWPGPSSSNGGIRFAPSLSWDTPVPGDKVCWLYDHTSQVIWWQGVFNNPSTTIRVQLNGCDSNDGWVDIYVDGVLEHSYNSYHATGTHVAIIGSGLTNNAHTVEIKTRAGGKDIHLDYVASVDTSVIPTLTEWGIIIFSILLLLWMGRMVIRRRNRAAVGV